MHKKKRSPWVVLIAILLGIIVGTATGTEAGIFSLKFYKIYEVVGKVFINALLLIVVPLVASSIVTGVARIGNDAAFGRLGLKIFGFYLGTSLLAILIGLFFVNLLQPGASISHETFLLSDPSRVQNLQEMITSKPSSIEGILLQIVPSSILDAFHGNMLGLIFLSLIFGYAIAKIEKEPSITLYNFWQGVFQSSLFITHLIMRFLPIAVFCLVAKTFADTGLGSLKHLALFFITVVLGLITFMFIGLPLLLKFVGKVDPWIHLRAMSPALVTAFSTSSSSATLPITMECVEKRAGVSNRICSLVVPLGTSINMSGSALYECVAALFIAQIYGIDISIGLQFLVVFLALITSIGVAGIPSASIVAILIIFKVIGIPNEGIALLFAVDRILDMCRTTVNVFSDSCCAVLVAATEGEKVLTRKVFQE